MTNTEVAPVVVDTDDEARCEALLQCVDQCCDATPCGRPAVARVSFRCDTPGCRRASHVLLMCGSCADQPAATVPSSVRRPL